LQSLVQAESESFIFHSQCTECAKSKSLITCLQRCASLLIVVSIEKSYDKAVEILTRVLNIPHIDECSVWSCIGKLFVQMGNLKDASDCFLKAKNLSDPDSSADKSRILVNL